MRRNAAVGYLPQRLNILDDALTVVDNVRAVAPRATVNDVRAGLARFLFRGARADQPAGTLSGGERFRAVLAALLLADPPPQLLLLDEPTNNLDMASVRQLSQALSATRARWSWSATTSRSCTRSASPAGCAWTATAAWPIGPP